MAIGFSEAGMSSRASTRPETSCSLCTDATPFASLLVTQRSPRRVSISTAAQASEPRRRCADQVVDMVEDLVGDDQLVVVAVPDDEAA